VNLFKKKKKLYIKWTFVLKKNWTVIVVQGSHLYSKDIWNFIRVSRCRALCSSTNPIVHHPRTRHVWMSRIFPHPRTLLSWTLFCKTRTVFYNITNSVTLWCISPHPPTPLFKYLFCTTHNVCFKITNYTTSEYSDGEISSHPRTLLSKHHVFSTYHWRTVFCNKHDEFLTSECHASFHIHKLYCLDHIKSVLCTLLMNSIL